MVACITAANEKWKWTQIFSIAVRWSEMVIIYGGIDVAFIAEPL